MRQNKLYKVKVMQVDYIRRKTINKSRATQGLTKITMTALFFEIIGQIYSWNISHLMSNNSIGTTRGKVILHNCEYKALFFIYQKTTTGELNFNPKDKIIDLELYQSTKEVTAGLFPLQSLSFFVSSSTRSHFQDYFGRHPFSTSAVFQS